MTTLLNSFSEETLETFQTVNPVMNLASMIRQDNKHFKNGIGRRYKLPFCTNGSIILATPLSKALMAGPDLDWHLLTC